MNKIQSPNFSRVKERNIVNIILHHTAMQSAGAALRRMCDPEIGVSAHYLIDKHDGMVTQLVDDSLIAHHAGVSYWRGEEALNKNSIGIELDNDGAEEFSEVLMQSLLKLLHQLLKSYNILPHNILGHLDIAPWRKLDPHHKFDWKLLHDNGFGMYPTIRSDDFAICLKNPQASLSKLGYDTRDMKATITAFNTHFNPKSYDNNCVDVWTNSSNIYLDNLLAQVEL